MDELEREICFLVQEAVHYGDADGHNTTEDIMDAIHAHFFRNAYEK